MSRPLTRSLPPLVLCCFSSGVQRDIRFDQLTYTERNYWEEGVKPCADCSVHADLNMSEEAVVCFAKNLPRVVSAPKYFYAQYAADTL